MIVEISKRDDNNINNVKVNMIKDIMYDVKSKTILEIDESVAKVFY